jgi:uncharacterized coiled-coil DUF342 family protein
MISLDTVVARMMELETKYYELQAKYQELIHEYEKLKEKREWVNLTVDELIDLERKHLSHENLTRAIEAKLKEKNA